MNKYFTISFWNGRLYERPSNFYSLNLMRKAIYIYLLYFALLFIPVAGWIWGPESMIYAYPVQVYSTSFFFNLLLHPAIAPFFYLFLGGQIIFLLMGIAGIYPRLSAIMIFFITTNLSNRMYLMNTAGEQLLLIFLFFLMFFPNEKEEESEFKNLLGNICSIACFIQMIFLYFFSGIFKLYGPEWRGGSALFLTLMMDEFSHPLIKENLTNNNFFLIIGTYVALLYQLLFPIVIWFKKIRRHFLWIGIGFHISIALIMGIFDFGMIMLIAYIQYMDNEKARKILTGFEYYTTKLKINRQKEAVHSSTP